MSNRSKHGLIATALGFALLWHSVALTQEAASVDPREALSLSAFQLIGTHNSYHIEPPREIFDLMLATGYSEDTDWPAAKLVPALSFTHPTIERQLELGIRLFELDLHNDPDGGRFAEPGVYQHLRERGTRFDFEVDPEGLLQQPGFKVFHTPDTDVRSHCLTFNRCLSIISEWSKANRGHFPIFIQIEMKEAHKPPVAGGYAPAVAAPFGDASWARLHEEIAAVFEPAQLVLPAQVQGEFTSINEAVRERGWPSLNQMRGKVVFLLLDDEDKQYSYIQFVAASGAPMVLFPSLEHRDPNTGWLRRDNPRETDIARRVREGFLVYTRADKHTTAARENSFSRRDRALLSGAQLVSTDFPVPDPRYGDYAVTIGGRYIGCNREYAPSACANGAR